MKLLRIYLFISLLTIVAYAKEVAFVPQYVHCPNEILRSQSLNILIAGEYPTQCYYMGESYLQVRQGAIYIRDTARVLDDPDQYCLQQLKRYQKLINIGFLDVGEYAIYFVNSKNEPIPLASVSVKN